MPLSTTVAALARSYPLACGLLQLHVRGLQSALVLLQGLRRHPTSVLVFAHRRTGVVVSLWLSKVEVGVPPLGRKFRWPASSARCARIFALPFWNLPQWLGARSDGKALRWVAFASVHSPASLGSFNSGPLRRGSSLQEVPWNPYVRTLLMTTQTPWVSVAGPAWHQPL